MGESGLSLIIPDNLAFVTDVTRTLWKYTLFRGTYVGMDWSPLGLVSCTCIWEPFRLVCVLLLDLPSLHVNHFGTKCFYTCIYSFVKKEGKKGEEV